MGDTIKARKGNKNVIDRLQLAELGFTVDEERLYIGGTNNNVPIPNAKDVKDVNDKVDTKIELCVSANLPAVADRKEKTIYFKITDSINPEINANVQISPAMGIKMI